MVGLSYQRLAIVWKATAPITMIALKDRTPLKDNYPVELVVPTVLNVLLPPYVMCVTQSLMVTLSLSVVTIRAPCLVILDFTRSMGLSMVPRVLIVPLLITAVPFPVLPAPIKCVSSAPMDTLAKEATVAQRSQVARLPCM